MRSRALRGFALPRLLTASSTLVLALAAPSSSRAHDLRIEIEEIERGIERIGVTLTSLRTLPAVPPAPVTPEEHRRALGGAELLLEQGKRQEALHALVARSLDPAFRKMPEYVDALLLTSELLEELDEPTGALHFARRALEHGGNPDQMAEAGARWFRIAREHQVPGDRAKVLRLWRDRRGTERAGVEMSAVASYEAAFALREAGRRGEALKHLAAVPSDSAFGSRAAYLAGVILVEQGDLESADRWFSAVMDWAMPEVPKDDPQRAIETEVRELAALSAGRLRYERGDLDEADAAYARIPDSSTHLGEACFERAYLALERKRKRGALNFLACVLDTGAGGDRTIDVKLMRASVLAHLARYDESVEDYEVLFESFGRERAAVKQAIRGLDDPVAFLFGAMERNSVIHGRHATPGPATVFSDTWTPLVDRAYRIDRDVSLASSELAELLAAIELLSERIGAEDSFPGYRLRQQSYDVLLRDIMHLRGHAQDLLLHSRGRIASTEWPIPTSSPEHEISAQRAQEIAGALDGFAQEVEDEVAKLSEEERERRAHALNVLRSIQAEAEGLADAADRLSADARGPIAGAVNAALEALGSRYDHGVMRAEAGILDTFWVKKEHVSQRIRALVLEKERAQQDWDETIRDLWAE